MRWTVYKHKISIILGLMVVVLAVLVQADEPSITITPVDDSIKLNEIGEVTVTFTNPTTKIYEYRFSSPDSIKWSIYTKPISDYLVKLYPGKERNVTFHIDPLYIDSPGQYGIRFDFLDTASNVVVEKNVIIEIVGDEVVETYIPNFKIFLGVPDEVDPRDELTIYLNISNIVPLEMNDVRVVIEGNTFPIIEDSVKVNSLGFRQMEYKVAFDKMLPPQSDTVTATVSYYFDETNKTYHRPPERANFNVLGYSTVSYEKVTEKSFMASASVYSMFNDGNVEAVGETLIPYGWFRKLFTNLENDMPVVENIDDGKKYYQWTESLAPGETKTFHVSSNYRPILYIIIVVILLIFAYYTFRSPILVEKFAAHIGKKDDDGISEIKIKLHVKNRTNSTFEEVKLIDKIPKIADLGSSFHVGTIKPSKILRHASKSTYLTWDIPALESYEERIITYKIISKLKIIGSVRLPSAMIKFKSRRFGRVKVESNDVLIRE